MKRHNILGIGVLKGVLLDGTRIIYVGCVFG